MVSWGKNPIKNIETQLLESNLVMKKSNKKWNILKNCGL